MSLNVHSAMILYCIVCVYAEEACRVCDNFRLPISLSIDGKLLLFLSHARHSALCAMKGSCMPAHSV